MFNHGHHQPGKNHKKDIEKQETDHLPLDIVLDRHSTQFNWQYCSRVNELIDFSFEKFAGKIDSNDLDTPTCRAGTSTDQHHGKECRLGRHRPEGEVGRGKAGCGYNGKNLENTVPKTVGKCAGFVVKKEKAKQKRRETYDGQIKPEFFVTKQCLEFPFDKKFILQGKVRTGKEHEKADNPGDTIILVAHDGLRVGGKSTCGHGCQ